MALWSDELEVMRPHLREEADAFIASFTSEPDDPSLPVPKRIAKQRAVADARVMRPEMAVDREISGPPARYGFGRSCPTRSTPSSCTSTAAASSPDRRR